MSTEAKSFVISQFSAVGNLNSLLSDFTIDIKIKNTSGIVVEIPSSGVVANDLIVVQLTPGENHVLVDSTTGKKVDSFQSTNEIKIINQIAITGVKSLIAPGQKITITDLQAMFPKTEAGGSSQFLDIE